MVSLLQLIDLILSIYMWIIIAVVILSWLVAFNVVTSIGYAVAAFAQAGPGERDTRGMAASARIDEPWIGAMVLAPALLDGARYYRPETTWLKWVSRTAKVGGALLIVRAAN